MVKLRPEIYQKWVHFIEICAIKYTKNRRNLVKRTNFRQIQGVWLLFKSVSYWREYGNYVLAQVAQKLSAIKFKCVVSIAK